MNQHLQIPSNTQNGGDFQKKLSMSTTQKRQFLTKEESGVIGEPIVSSNTNEVN